MFPIAALPPESAYSSHVWGPSAPFAPSSAIPASFRSNPVGPRRERIAPFPFVRAHQVHGDPKNPEQGDSALIALIGGGIDVRHTAFRDRRGQTCERSTASRSSDHLREARPISAQCVRNSSYMQVLRLKWVLLLGFCLLAAPVFAWQTQESGARRLYVEAFATKAGAEKNVPLSGLSKVVQQFPDGSSEYG
jgi:hypothetical protein